MNIGFWIFPDGQIVHFEFKRHIDLIIDNSELYGENIDEIRTLYSEYNEPLRFEGIARQIIMHRVIQRGFIRIRQQKNQWVIQCSELTNEKQGFLSDWSNLVRHYDRYADVVIDQIGVSEDRVIRTSLNCISDLSGHLLDQN